MNGVILVEGSKEIGRADFKLFRLLEWAGFHRDQFTVCSSDVTDATLDAHSPRVVVPMGHEAAERFGHPALLDTRGYVGEGPSGSYLIPTVSPNWIQRGNSRWSAAFIADIQKAVRVSQSGMPPQVLDYKLDPSPMEAYCWAKQYLLDLSVDPRIRLAFDIETPGKGDDEEDLEVGDGGPDRTWNIERIGFSYRGLSALSIPWSPEYMACVRAIMGSNGEKVVWNAGFDVPRLRRVGIGINGIIHDAMVAWHILHSDLPKSLKFVATFTCPWQPAWKHLSGARPAFYNATDADVEVRSMQEISAELVKTGLWDVYERDVVELEPILTYMSSMGMPVDSEIRLDRAIKLQELLGTLMGQMESLIPLEARRIAHVYEREPKDTSNLASRRGLRRIPVCDRCGAERPRKDHFKRYVKKQNLCAGGGTREVSIEVDEFYRLADFTPSRDQLVRYHQWIKRPLPMTYDKKERKKKVSFAEKQLKELMVKYPEDKLYSIILDYREADKLAGTYLGRPVAIQG
jgi:hypothetical protein